MLNRRRLLKTGLVGLGILTLAGIGLQYSRGNRQGSAARPHTSSRLTQIDHTVLAAIVPAILPNLPKQAAPEIIADIQTAIDGFPPLMQKEIKQLFELLSFAPTRILIAGVYQPWHRASLAQIEHFLTSWRTSRFSLLNSAYEALRQFILAAWYGNPKSWSAIDYPGPPAINPMPVLRND